MADLPNNTPNNSTEPPVKSNDKTAIFLLMDLADTTWRLFVPIIGLMLIGLMLDGNLHTKPWLMIGGIVLGCAISVWLIRAQLKRKVT